MQDKCVAALTICLYAHHRRVESFSTQVEEGESVLWDSVGVSVPECLGDGAREMILDVARKVVAKHL